MLNETFFLIFKHCVDLPAEGDGNVDGNAGGIQGEVPQRHQKCFDKVDKAVGVHQGGI